MAGRDGLRAVVERARHAVALGDVVLSDAEVETLRFGLRSWLAVGIGVAEVDGAVAILAVNALRNQPDRTGFRAHFCRLLGADIAQWQESFGPAIERFCVQTFGDEARVGQPYRYVGLVWRHAGLRPADVVRVADWLHELADPAGGWQGLLSRPEWVAEAVTRFRSQSRYLDEFMKTNGAGLCHHVLLLLVRLAQGHETIEEVDPRYLALVNALRERQKRLTRLPPTLVSSRLPDPVMVLREDVGTLELCFDPPAVAAGAYECKQLGPVTMPRVQLAQPLAWYSGTVGHGAARRSWALAGWRRGPETQYFRMTDGRRLSVGEGASQARAPRQECYALSTEIAPPGVEVLEQFGRFRLGDGPVYLLRVQPAENAPDDRSPPELVWATPRSDRLQGACAGDIVVWNGVQPQLRVIPLDACDVWRVMAEWGGTVRRLAYRPDGAVEMDTPAGVVVNVWLEPQREQRRDFDPAALTVHFVRLPPLALEFPGRLLAGDEACRFTCAGDVEWGWPNARPLEPGRSYEVAPDLPLVEGTVRASRTLSIPIVRLIPRAGVRSADGQPSAEGGVWWLDYWKPDVLVTGWPEQAVRCRLTSPLGDSTACELPGAFDLAGHATFSSVAVRERVYRASPLVHVDVLGPDGWVATGRWIGLARRLPKWLVAHRGEPLRADLGAEIQTWLRPVVQLVAGVLPSAAECSSLRTVPGSLVPWVRSVCAEVAQTWVEQEVELPRGLDEWIPEPLRAKVRAVVDRSRLAAWTAWIQTHMRDGGDPPPSVGFPGLLTQAAKRYFDAGQDDGISRRSKRLLERVYLDLCEGLPDADEPQERAIAFVLAVLALWHRQGVEELRRAAGSLLIAVRPPAAPVAISRLCATNLPASDLRLGNLPVWPSDLSLETG